MSVQLKPDCVTCSLNQRQNWAPESDSGSNAHASAPVGRMNSSRHLSSLGLGFPVGKVPLTQQMPERP